MPVVVLLIVLAVIVFLLVKSLQDAKRQQESGGGSAASRARPARPSAPRPQRQRARRRQPALNSEALAAHVAKLRQAVETELISVDEAVDSIVRQTDGAVGPEAARKLLQQEDDAA